MSSLSPKAFLLAESSAPALVVRFFETLRGGVRPLAREHFKLRSIVCVIIHEKLFDFLHQVLIEVFEGENVGMCVAGFGHCEQPVIAHRLAFFGLLSFNDADQP